MMADYVEPLEAALWFRRIEMIAAGALSSLESSLRHASHLLQLAPQALRPAVAFSIDEEPFEALLESGDFDAAACCLFTTPIVLSIDDPSGPGLIKATVHGPVLNGVISASGETVAQAVLNAWTSCMLAVRTKYGADLTGLGRSLRTDDHSEQGRPCSVHHICSPEVR
jgi:hypothetical protein